MFPKHMWGELNAKTRTVRTLSDLVLENASSGRPKDIGVVRSGSDIEIGLVVSRKDRDIVPLLNAALLAEAGDLVHAALDVWAIASLDFGSAVVKGAVLRARSVLGAARYLGLDIVAGMGHGGAGDGREDEGG